MSDTTSHPAKPLLIYDGDCGFCRRSVARWRTVTGEHVDYAPSQEAADRFPQVSREQFGQSVVLVEPDGGICFGARAVFRALASVPGRGLGWWAYRRVPGFAPASEAAYRFVAAHRGLMATATRWLWGAQIGPPSHLLTRWAFLRLLGLTYLIAFVSLGVQVIGLIGENGITPAQDYLSRIQAHFGDEGWQSFPTLFWWFRSDAALRGACWLGAGLSVLLILRIAPVFTLILLWGLYLSLVVAGGVFLSFQWDILLLETGFLAIFFAPLRIWPRLESEPPPSRIALWLLRWLLFRLVFLSGAVKLTSGDTTWRDLTALDYHYLTQPLPTWLAWYAHQLPGWFQKASTVVMYAIELGLPFLIFAPRRLRFVAAGGITFLMLCIAATGNYNFFNLLTVALCVTLMDDAFLRRFFPKRTAERAAVARATRWKWPRRALLGTVAVFIVTISSIRGISGTWRDVKLRPWMLTLVGHTNPWHTINTYGLFRVMTTRRAEIVVEGSRDQIEWREYRFRWKPGDMKDRPRFVQPHQPRLDWQMWFAALGDYRSRSNQWFTLFLSRLAQGEPEVLALLDDNPFPDEPPRYLRAQLYVYAFTDAKTRRETGAWWTREYLGPYTPTMTRRN